MDCLGSLLLLHNLYHYLLLIRPFKTLFPAVLHLMHKYTPSGVYMALRLCLILSWDNLSSPRNRLHSVWKDEWKDVTVREWEMKETSEEQKSMTNTLSPLWCKYCFFLLFVLIHLDSGCVLLSLSGPYPHSLSGSKTHLPLSVFPFCSHTLLFWTAASDKQRRSGQHTLCRSEVLFYLTGKYHFFGSVPCTTLQFAATCVHVGWESRYIKCITATELSTAVWMWSTSIYSYLLMCVLMNFSHVIVLYSLQDKWPLKETLVWIR